MLTAEDLKIMRRAETEIHSGRKAEPGVFYLERRTLTGTDPHTGEKTYSETFELAQPTIQVLKGDEHEIAVGGMKLAAGDLICTFAHNKHIPRTEPAANGQFYYDRVKFRDEYYKITNVWPKGMGLNANRKILFATKEK